MNEKTCPTCTYCGPDIDKPICHKRLSTNLSPCGSWEPRGFDYDRMAKEYLAGWESLKRRLEEVQAERGGTADEKMRRKQRINKLKEEIMEQKRTYTELSRRAEARKRP